MVPLAVDWTATAERATALDPQYPAEPGHNNDFLASVAPRAETGGWQQLANSWDESFWAVCALPRDRFRFLLSPVVSPAPLAPRRHPPRGQRGCRTPENLTFWAVVTRMPRPGSSQKLSNPVGGRNFGFCAHPRHQNSMFLPPADTLGAYVGPR